jgi:hypothetical protein
MHLTFDRSLDREEVEKAAADSGDYTQDMPDRRYARLWLTPRRGRPHLRGGARQVLESRCTAQ